MDYTPPLWKQLLGAGLGASLALLLYGVYELSAPLLLAYIPPQYRSAVETRMASKTPPDDTQKAFARIAARARKFVEDTEGQSSGGVENVVQEVEKEPAVVLEETPPSVQQEVPIKQEVLPVRKVAPRRLLGSVRTPATADVPVRVHPQTPHVPELSGAGVALWGTILLALLGATFCERKRLRAMLRHV